MSDTEEPEDRRTEGVRIIGAQEAAEAAARPDVVRRRTRREKRYGDRPDQPEPASDLPKITISTTETEGRDPDRFGAVPVVRPGDEGTTDQRPRWADDEAPAEAEHFGHARIVDDPEPPAEPVAAEGQYLGRDLADDEPVAPPSSPAWEDESGLPASDTVDEATQQWSAQDFAAAEVLDEGPVGGADEESDRAWEAFDEPSVADADEDDSFVLPHWTEPPTGQVPKVVIGDDAPDPDSLATYGSQPRWRDEGERGVVTDFDDLIDDGPRLGALGGDDSVEDDFFSDVGYDDDGGRYFDDADDLDDEYDEYEDSDGEVAPPRRPPRQRQRGASEEARPSGDRDLVTAVAVGVGLVAVGLLCFAIGPLATAVLATAVVTVAAWEYFAAVRSSGHNPATLLGLASVVGLMIAAFTSGLAAYPVVLALSVIAGLLWYLWVAPGERGVQNLGLTMLGVMWIGVLGSFATLFLGLGDVLQDRDAGLTSNPGIGVLIAAIVAAVSHDIGAYFIGRFFGKTPLSAASPNKTQEGLAGGVLVSLAVTVVVVGIVGIDPIGSDLAQTFVFALLCAIAAPLGDLAESFVKRDLAIKDMGSVLPGHGGVLDRFDGVLFVLPVAYFVTLLFDIWTGIGS